MRDMTAELARALSFALENPYSDFYRRKYGSAYKNLLAGPLDAFPFVTREEIDDAPIFERTFVPRGMVRFIRTTSGSTGRSVVGFPMLEEPELEAHRRALGFLPDPLRVRYFEPYMDDFAIKSVLMFSAGAFVHEPRLRIEEKRRYVSGEYAQPKLTAQLAKTAGVDCIVGNPSGVVEFARYMEGIGHAQAVRLVVSVGERPTTQQLEALGRSFPNAKVGLQYGLTETQGLVGYTCPERLSHDAKALHPARGQILLELIDPETGASLALEPGQEGEVVVTTLEPLAFPLIRYRTGDFAVIRPGSCSCLGAPLLFECLGRMTLDRIRVPRGVLTIAAIEEAVSGLPCRAADFSAHWQSEGQRDGLRVTLFVEGDAADERRLRDALAQSLSVAPAVSYADIERDGLVAPLQLSLMPASARPEGDWRKRKRLVR